jgi:hypothetical protein
MKIDEGYWNENRHHFAAGETFELLKENRLVPLFGTRR